MTVEKNQNGSYWIETFRREVIAAGKNGLSVWDPVRNMEASVITNNGSFQIITGNGSHEVYDIGVDDASHCRLLQLARMHPMDIPG